MAYRMGEMAMLRASDPEKFARKLRAAIQKFAGVMVHVAQDLDVGLTTAKRWVTELKLDAAVHATRKATRKATKAPKAVKVYSTPGKRSRATRGR